MTTRMYIREIKRFLKENIKLITILSVIGAGLFFMFLNVAIGSNSNEQQSNSNSEQINDVSKRYAQFKIYVEKSDHSPFLNNALLESILLDAQQIKKLEELAGIEIQLLLEEQVKKEFSATPTDRGVIGFEHDTVTDSLKFVSKIGTENQRLLTVQHIFSLIKNNEIEFLANKQITIIEEPHLHEYTPDEIRKAEQATIAQMGQENTQMMLLVEVILSVSVGILIGVIFTMFYHVYTSKINYAFNYFINDNDIFIIARDNIQDLIYSINEPDTAKKLIVSQVSFPEEVLEKLSNEVNQTNSVLEYSPEENFVEIIVIVVEGVTDKDWYSEQLNYSRTLKSRIKVIQTNRDIFTMKSI